MIMMPVNQGLSFKMQSKYHFLLQTVSDNWKLPAPCNGLQQVTCKLQRLLSYLTGEHHFGYMFQNTKQSENETRFPDALEV